MIKTNQKAFTIVELMIATSVFAVVLLTALAGFTQIGRLFYKGVSITQTQNAASQVMQDINGYFKTASSIYIPPDIPTNTPPSPYDYTNTKYNYYCVGSARYTYKLDQVFLTSSTPNYTPSAGNYGLLKDILPGSSACASPCISAGNPAGCTPFQASSRVELLGNNMRLGDFAITSSSAVPNFYAVSLFIVYGDNVLLSCASSPNYATCAANKDYKTYFCKGNFNDQQFCAVNRVDSGIYRGL